MMCDIDQSILNLLNDEQSKIINSSEGRILVSAGPGSGKTHTIISRISKELFSLPEYRGVIACSFTKEASKQLKTRLELITDIKASFVGTIDSFILSIIIEPYKNRYLKTIKKPPIDKLKIVFPEMKSEANRLTKAGINDKTREDLLNYNKKWMDNFFLGFYEISFPTYRLASEIIISLEEARDYLKNSFETIYIDEAQDMNDFQYMFLNILLKKCDMKCVLVGDKNQSIYQFRGARPELFYRQRDNGFCEYFITVSMRCHKSILDYSNLIVNSTCKFTKNDVIRVLLDAKPQKEILQKMKGNFLVLCETNSEAMSIYAELSQHQDNIVYTQPMSLSDRDFSDEFLEYVEEIVKFYLNFSNNEPSLTYSIEDLKQVLSNLSGSKNIKDSILDPSGKSICEYLFYLFDFLGIEIGSKLEVELTSILQNAIHVNHYKKYKNMNRIMTIHSSKGLEADNVFVVLGIPYHLDDEYFRKLFVSFSRAKDNLFISYSDHSDALGSQIDSILRKNLLLL
jgi:superfamily I DNA/RNA helicase